MLAPCVKFRSVLGVEWPRDAAPTLLYSTLLYSAPLYSILPYHNCLSLLILPLHVSVCGVLSCDGSLHRALVRWTLRMSRQRERERDKISNISYIIQNVEYVLPST